MIAEFKSEDSKMAGGYYNADLEYKVWLEQNLAREQGIGLDEGRVPAIQYVSFDETGRAIGFLHLRLRLNENLFFHGGHIGYSIRPSERRKGYAKEQLRQGLNEARQKNISNVLVTCDEANEGSRKTILSQGGRYDNTVEGTERYWIEVQDE